MNLIAAIAVASIILTGLVFIGQAQAQTISARDLALSTSNSSQSGTNAAQFLLFDTLNKQSLTVFMKANGGPFANEVLTIKGSLTGSNYTTIETEATGTGTTKGFHYSASYVNVTGQAANPLDFRYLNFSLPTLGVNQTSVIQVTAK